MKRSFAPGDVVRVRSTHVGLLKAGSKGTVVEGRDPLFGVMFDRGWAECCPREVAKLRDQTPLPPPLRFRLPYGLWSCADGTEVLFNRNYRPLLIRKPGMPARLAAGNERVPFVGQRWFYHDGNTPWDDFATLRACMAIVAEWGFEGWRGEGLPDAARLNSGVGLVGWTG